MSWREEYDSQRREAADARRAKNAEYVALSSGPPLPVTVAYEDEFDRLEEIGGPIQIEGFPQPSEVDFGGCDDHPERWTLEVLMKYTSDLVLARRHWPWIAHFLHLYEVTRDFHHTDKDLPPSAAAELLKSIRSAAASLERDLNLFQEATLIWRDDSPLKGGHLEYLEQLLAQGAAGHPGEVDQDPAKMWDFFLHYRNWRADLNGLIQGAQIAQAALSTELLTSSNRSRLPGLKPFVARLAAVWTSLTGRQPSAHKVHTRSRSESKFVLFVQDVAAMSEVAVRPSASQVASALAQHNKRRF